MNEKVDIKEIEEFYKNFPEIKKGELITKLGQSVLFGRDLLSEVKRLQKELEEQKSLIPWIGELAQAKVEVQRLRKGIEKVLNMSKVRKKAEFTTSKPEFWVLMTEEFYNELKKLVEEK